MKAEVHLPQVVFAPDTLGAGHCSGQRRHQQDGEDAEAMAASNSISLNARPLRLRLNGIVFMRLGYLDESTRAEIIQCDFAVCCEDKAHFARPLPPAFALDGWCGNNYFPFIKRFNCWPTSARKSETQVFPAFLFAGCRQDKRRFFSV